MLRIGASHADLHASWQEVLDSGHFSEGKYVRLFEEAVSEFYGQHAVAFSNCGAGLFATMRHLENGMFGVPTNTFAATMTMAVEADHAITLLDAAKNDLSMGLEDLIPAHVGLLNSGADLTGVILTHVGGWAAKEYDEIGDYCRETGLVLIEDAAHALGVASVGKHAAATTFSLYPTKAVPAGEGGVVITPNETLAGDLREFRNYGKYTEDGVIRYGPGFNLRMDEWTAVVAYHQFKRLGEILEARQEAADRLSKVVEPLYSEEGSNWYKFVAPADYPATRKAGKVYAVSDQMTTLLDMDPLPNAARHAEQHLCLPLWEGAYAGMTTGQIEKFLQGGDYEGPQD